MAFGKSSANLVVAITGQDLASPTFAKLQSDLAKAKKGAADTSTAMSRMGGVLKGAALGAAAAAGTMAVAFAVEGVKAAVEEEQALVKLRKALDNVGQGFAQTEVDAFIDRMMFATGVADDELRPAFQSLVTATRDASQAQSLLQLALDISAAKGQSLSTVSMALSKAASGSTGALTRLGVPLSENAKKAGNFQQAVSELSATFAGQADAAADTFAGRMQRLQVAFSELQESFGSGFLDGLVGAQGATDDLTASLIQAQQQAEDLGLALGSVTNAAGGLLNAYNSLNEGLAAYSEWGPVSKALANTFQMVFMGGKVVLDVLGAVAPDAEEAAESFDAAAVAAARLAEAGTNMSRRLLNGMDDASSQAGVLSRQLTALERSYVSRYQLVITTEMRGEVEAARWAMGNEGSGEISWGSFGPSKASTRSSSGGSSGGGSSSSVGQTPAEKRAEKRRQAIAALRESLSGFGRITGFDRGAFSTAERALEDATRAVTDAQTTITNAKRDLLAIGPGTDPESVRKRAEARQALADAEADYAKAVAAQGTARQQKADTELTGRNLLKSTEQRLARIQRFGRVLTRLDRLGLSPSLLSEIAAAGPEDGLALGQAILDQPGVVKGLRKAYKGIDKVSGDIARYVANDTYMPGANAVNARNARSAADDVQPVNVTLTLDSAVVARQLVRLRRRNGGAPLGLG